MCSAIVLTVSTGRQRSAAAAIFSRQLPSIQFCRLRAWRHSSFESGGHVQVVARYLEVPLAHVKARRGFGKGAGLPGRAVATSPRPYPKSKLCPQVRHLGGMHVATHKMQHERILTVARRTAHGLSRITGVWPIPRFGQASAKRNSQFLGRPVGSPAWRSLG